VERTALVFLACASWLVFLGWILYTPGLPRWVAGLLMVVAPPLLPLPFTFWHHSAWTAGTGQTAESVQEEIPAGARAAVSLGRFCIWGTTAGVGYALVLRLSQALS
jgi:hypothetical protein